MTNNAKTKKRYVFSDQVGHLLRRAYQQHIAIFQNSIPDAQLTSAQFVIMCFLLDTGSSSLADVAKATVIDQATVRDVLNRLKKRDLVKIKKDYDDRRKVIVDLTESGRSLTSKMQPVAAEITENTLGNLNPAERFALEFLLKKMLD